MAFEDQDPALLQRALAAEHERDEALAHVRRLLEKQRDDRQEAQHHLRNVLSVIRAVARRTSDDAEDVDTYCALLDGRLSTYMRINATDLDNRHLGTDLGSLISDELLGFGIKEDDDRIKVSGSSIRLTSSAAGLMALAFHDLTTDLVLSGRSDVPSFSLHVDWRVVRESETDRLVIDWTEFFPDGTLRSSAASAWSGWLQQAIKHQLDGTVSNQIAAAQQSRQFRLPRPYFTHEGVVRLLSVTDTLVKPAIS